ncbi:SEC-C metal-binding domain-containing protein [Mycobacterium sp.]|uniref:SEC-C metal-binding domain-containing protein n=1 Tax=Mycobacterium sp. TaxID=1785 RepID=UPI003A876C1E
MTHDALTSALLADGVDLGPEPEDTVAEVLNYSGELFLPLSDHRWAWIPGLLRGRIFTHRLSALEAAHDVVELGEDLGPVAMLTEGETYQQLSDGSPISEAWPFEHGHRDGDVLAARGVPAAELDDNTALLVLPAGRFAALGVAEDDLVGLRVTADGFELAAIPQTAPCDVGAKLAGLLDSEPDRPEMLDMAVWTVCADDDGLFRDAAVPLVELLTASGLARDGDWIARSGFDFAAWRVAGRVERIEDRYNLGKDEALAVLATVHLYEQTLAIVETAMAAQDDGDTQAFADIVSQLAPPPEQQQQRQPNRDSSQEPGSGRKTVRMAMELLAEPAVAAAVLAESGASQDDRQAAVALGVFAESGESLAPPAARPALRWLRAMAHERLGDIEEAEANLLASESLDPSWPLTLMALARYASDRGDAERGLSLLRRAGVPADHYLVEVLSDFLPVPRRDLGRNDRCWCGSGRKYKVCHLNREELPLEERAAWLYQKASGTLRDEGPFLDMVIEAAQARARHWDSRAALAHALEDGLAGDAVLFEGGAFEDFVNVRGPLLPADELLLAQQWLLVERSVYEVLEVKHGQGFTVRDTRTGDIHEVRERAGSTQVQTGQFYCARVVPAGETMQIFGGIEPLSLSERDSLIALLDGDPGPVELVEALSARFAPPELRNTEGEPLIMCNATLRVADPAALALSLDGAYERQDDHPGDAPVWFEHVVTHGVQRIRANLELHDDHLHVHANSVARFDRVLAAVRAMDPSATLLEETREPAGDIKAIQQLAAGQPPAPAQTLDPALDPALDSTIAAALDQMTRQHEKAWLDEALPALAGHTPRQCADDPSRRPDLIRLLDSFPEDDGRPGTMSPARLRAALGLD